MDENWVAGFIGALYFLAVGIVCLFFPKKAQQYFLNAFERHTRATRFNPFLIWMRTSIYILTLRIIGIASIAAFVFISLILIGFK